MLETVLPGEYAVAELRVVSGDVREDGCDLTSEVHKRYVSSLEVRPWGAPRSPM